MCVNACVSVRVYVIFFAFEICSFLKNKTVEIFFVAIPSPEVKFL